MPRWHSRFKLVVGVVSMAAVSASAQVRGVDSVTAPSAVGAEARLPYVSSHPPGSDKAPVGFYASDVIDDLLAQVHELRTRVKRMEGDLQAAQRQVDQLKSTRYAVAAQSPAPVAAEQGRGDVAQADHVRYHVLLRAGSREAARRMDRVLAQEGVTVQRLEEIAGSHEFRLYVGSYRDEQRATARQREIARAIGEEPVIERGS